MNNLEALKEGLKIFYKYALPYIIKVSVVIGLYGYLLELVRFYHFRNVGDEFNFWFPAMVVSIIVFVSFLGIMEAGQNSLCDKSKKKKKKK